MSVTNGWTYHQPVMHRLQRCKNELITMRSATTMTHHVRTRFSSQCSEVHSGTARGEWRSRLRTKETRMEQDFEYGAGSCLSDTVHNEKN